MTTEEEINSTIQRLRNEQLSDPYANLSTQRQAEFPVDTLGTQRVFSVGRRPLPAITLAEELGGQLWLNHSTQDLDKSPYRGTDILVVVPDDNNGAFILDPTNDEVIIGRPKSMTDLDVRQTISSILPDNSKGWLPARTRRPNHANS